MPVIIPPGLPARSILESEKAFVLDAAPPGSEPIRVAILNLMPTKVATETQLLRMLNTSPLPVEITLLHMASHLSKNTAADHIDTFYHTFSEVKDDRFDGLIITGAPVELLPFEEVDYWDELVEILDWKQSNVTSTYHICWAVQADLYHKYGIPKYTLPAKIFGVFPHRVQHSSEPLLQGFDDLLFLPHSRHTEIRRKDIERCPELEILIEAKEAGIFLLTSSDRRQVYATGHPEYDRLTLKYEYDRDLQKGLSIAIPKNYFPGDDPSSEPPVRWRSHGALLYTNWLHYCCRPKLPKINVGPV